jgi:hypothetical protein
MRVRFLIRVSVAIAGSLLAAVVTLAQTDFEGPPIHYLTAEVNDPVSQLAAKLAQGKVSLDYDAEFGYLPAVLNALDVPVSSQTLVFSKTSLQLNRISPRRPRALYFNDDVYVGYCQRGDVLEFATTDAKQGATFYTLKQDREGTPAFVRDRGQCLSCHASNRTQNVPGYLVRSVFADRAGQAILGSGTFTTDHKSPFEQRWGGWYVTGTHGKMRHMGNTTFVDNSREPHDLESGANVLSLDGIVATQPYLSPHSDLVALMVLEHQTQMHNAIAAANYETRAAIHQSYQMNELLEREEGHISDSAHRRIDAVADRVVRYLLMCDEFVLQDPVSGTSEFANEFQARGIRDPKGRSLRDLDLQTRLFRYPCSYLIHNAAFDGLPEQVRNRIASKLLAVLEGSDRSPDFKHLEPSIRKEILEILAATKPDLFPSSQFTGLN